MGPGLCGRSCGKASVGEAAFKKHTDGSKHQLVLVALFPPDHIFVSNFSGDRERFRCTISSISGSAVHGVVALTFKSSNVFISNFLSIITYNRAISWFLLPHSHAHIVSGVQEIKT